MTKATAAGSKRFEYLDALRGIAALAVLVFHICTALWKTMPPAIWLKSIVVDGVNLGLYGVMLFFMISGFIIPFSFSGRTPARKFIISRVFRLYPAY